VPAWVWWRRGGPAARRSDRVLPINIRSNQAENHLDFAVERLMQHQLPWMSERRVRGRAGVQPRAANGDRERAGQALTLRCVACCRRAAVDGQQQQHTQQQQGAWTLRTADR
jgi:hypothetical protein